VSPSEDRAVRGVHCILAGLVLEPSGGDGETVVLTIWPGHEVLDARIGYDDLTGKPALARSDCPVLHAGALGGVQ
jgi:hypothetical protein